MCCLRIAFYYGLGVLLALGLAQPALAQHAPADGSLTTQASHALRQRYTRALGTETRLYNGPEYVRYVRRDTNGHRFFGADSVRPATVVYEGRTYPEVPLRYDLVRGQLVLQAPGGAFDMRLLNEQVARFTLDGHTFVRLLADSSRSSPVSTGFYDLLVDGPVQLLAARQKDLQERTTYAGITSDITASEKYFVCKNRRYYPVSKAATLLRLFPENKAALRQCSKAHKLRFGPETREQSLGALVRYQATLAASAAN